MTIHTILFNIYASLALTSGIGVIISQNPIHSVIFLILVFCNATGLLLLFKIELLAMMFIIIYVGAIAVLFLFVVMMLNLKVQGNEENSALAQSDQVPVGPSWYNLSSQKQANSSPARKTWVATGIGGTT